MARSWIGWRRSVTSSMATESSDQIDAAARGTPWAAVTCLSLLTFVLVASEFMPVSLLTPIAGELAITEGQAGQAISISGLFAVVTSLCGNSVLRKLDRRTAVLLYTGVLIVSGLAVTFAPNYLVFMIGRALIGTSIGGFWSLSTAILARLVSRRELPRAIAMLQGGTAFASVIAAPLGSFLGGLIGWRGVFFIVVPIGLASLVWQLAVLPSMPADRDVSVAQMFGLLRNRVFAIGMAATTLAFMGQFSLSTYLRPFLEGVTGLDVNTLSLVLLALGIAGLIGTTVAGFLLRSHLTPVAHPIPVAWNTWMTRVIPEDLEAGGGLQVALIQFAITFGAAIGGLLFDSAGWWSPFVLATVLLTGSALLAALTSPRSGLLQTH
jgi:predicted MFS family arabinose efflux permease